MKDNLLETIRKVRKEIIEAGREPNDYVIEWGKDYYADWDFQFGEIEGLVIPIGVFKYLGIFHKINKGKGYSLKLARIYGNE